MESSTQPKRNSHLVEYLIWGALAATIVGVATAFFVTRLSARLSRPLIMAGAVPDFALTNQLGQPFGLTNLLGHVWVADVIFTRCPMSCERMSQRMRVLQDELGSRSPVRFLSVTADPVNDTPDILRKYAERHGADANRWTFVTGVKSNVYKLAVDGLKFVVRDKTEDKTTPDDLFIHSTKFVLVDKHGQIRGYFEGTDEEERKQLVMAVKQLQRER
jgi:protein SCO1